MTKKLLAVFMASMIAMTISAQENPFRIGIKLGIPNLAGLGLEYVTPVAGNRLAAALDLSYIPIPFNVEGFEGSLNLQYIGIGPSFYFKKDNDGKGPYFHAGVGMLNLGLKGSQSSTIMGSNNVPIPVIAEASSSLKAGFAMFKIGFKWGNAFWFRPEFGYSMISMDKVLEFSANFTATDPVTNQTLTETQQFKKDLNIPVSGGPVFTIGFGFAF